MAEYIDKDKLLNAIECIDISNCTDIDDIFTEVERTIDEQPAADVVEVRRGKWMGEPSVTISANRGRTIRSTIYKCSLCNKTNSRIKKPYCPNCGARMDGDTE